MTDENTILLGAAVGAGAAVANKAYDDLVHPAAKEIGQGLGFAGLLFKTIMQDCYHGADSLRKKCKQFIKKTEETIGSIPPERRIEPSLGVLQPIIAGSWGALDSDLLQALFLNLLKSAMDKNSSAGVLPVYGELIKQITPDEALILVFLKKYPDIHPTINVGIQRTSPNIAYRIILEKLSLLQKYVKVEYPQNIPIYLENLSRLGFISIDFSAEAVIANRYKEIEELPEVIAIQQSIKENNEEHYFFQHGIFKLTNFGKAFCKICISDLTVATFL